MHISWLGQTCVKLQTKNSDEDVVILIDAYKPKTGDFPRSFTPQIALYSRDEEDAATLSQNPFVMSSLGECEIKGVMVYSYYTEHGTKIFKINAEGMNIVHLGKLTKKISGPILEKLGTPDILFIPVGGEKEYLTAEDAAELISEIEPRVIIPVGFQCDTDPKARPVSEFIKEIGIKPEATDIKFIIKKKDLPPEETKLFVLEKNY
jgi:L-ascorbate metabolism protein UlaG (beta-lactamase superfamily)